MRLLIDLQSNLYYLSTGQLKMILPLVQVRCGNLVCQTIFETIIAYSIGQGYIYFTQFRHNYSLFPFSLLFPVILFLYSFSPFFSPLSFLLFPFTFFLIFFPRTNFHGNVIYPTPAIGVEYQQSI